jgi:hypothetical protein
VRHRNRGLAAVAGASFVWVTPQVCQDESFQMSYAQLP